MGNQIGAGVVVGLFVFLLVGGATAGVKDLGNGFVDYGVAAPISNHRGTAAMVDGEGRNVLGSFLMDHRGGYELLLIDAETGKSAEFPMPFFKEGMEFDAPYASLLSSTGKFYTHFRDHFVEFDPKKRAFTFSRETTPQMAMGMTEDDRGVIWSVTYPQSGVVSFDPKTREFRDYGQVYKQNWQQYPRYVAVDDQGWVYFGLGNTASQIVAMDPKSGKATPMLEEGERTKGLAYVYRDMDGKVYGRPMGDEKAAWHEFYKGEGKKLESHATTNAKVVKTGSQIFFEARWPDGSVAKDFDLVNRKLKVIGAGSKKEKEVSFTYASEGAIVMGVAAAGNGMIAGGTTFPMRCFWLDPKSGEMSDRAAYGQWNTVTRLGDHYFVGGYPGGFLLDWQPGKPWVSTEKAKGIKSNPAFYRDCDPILHRPTCLLPTADGKTVILAGTPEYGYTGGGLLFWDREKGKGELIDDQKLVPDQSTQSLLEIGDGKLFGGTTTTPGTGGEKKAKEAELYVMDFATRKIEWRKAVLPGVQDYTQLCNAPGGLLYGVADRKTFFVFDPAKKEVVHQRDVEKEFGQTSSQQGPRIFIQGDGGKMYLLFLKGIVEIEPGTHALKKIANAPVTIDSGGDYWEGKIWFVSGSHVCSHAVK
jgi:hypothetical protein